MILMAISSKRIRRWIYPLLAVCFGLLAGYHYFPSEQDTIYTDWKDQLDQAASQSYEITTTYMLDEEQASRSTGFWHPELSEYEVSTPVSDGDFFTFSLYILPDQFYVNAGEQWLYGETPHRFLQEARPLDQPFGWTAELLLEADSVTRTETAGIIEYEARFPQFDNVDFRGLYLNEQKSTTLTMKMSEGYITSIVLDAEPIRPEDMNPLNSYPDKLTYEIALTAKPGDKKPTLPPGVEGAEKLE